MQHTLPHVLTPTPQIDLAQGSQTGLVMMCSMNEVVSDVHDDKEAADGVSTPMLPALSMLQTGFQAFTFFFSMACSFAYQFRRHHHHVQVLSNSCASGCSICFGGDSGIEPQPECIHGWPGRVEIHEAGNEVSG